VTKKPQPSIRPDMVGGDALTAAVKAFPWGRFVEYGTVKVQIRGGKPMLVTLERTHRLD